MGSAVMHLLSRVGGMWLSPRRTLRALAAGRGGDPFEALALYLFVQLCVGARLLYKSAMLAGEAPDIARRRATDALWSLARNDVALLVVVTIALLLLGQLVNARARRRGEPRPLSSRGLAAAAAYLALPVALLKAAGALTLWLGVDQWWLPHHPVDSYVVVVRNQVDWGRFWLKCAVAYGPSAILLVDLVVALLRGRARDAAPPSSFPAQALGLASLAALVVLAFGAVADVASESGKLRPRLPGDEMPSLTLPWLQHPEGAKRPSFDVRDYRGKVLVLDFWASWCAPCRQAFRYLDQLYRTYADDGLYVLGVGVDEDPRAGRGFLARMRPRFDTAWDGKGQVSARFGVASLPTTVLLDKDGAVIHRQQGFDVGAHRVLEAHVRRLVDAI